MRQAYSYPLTAYNGQGISRFAANVGWLAFLRMAGALRLAYENE